MFWFIYVVGLLAVLVIASLGVRKTPKTKEDPVLMAIICLLVSIFWPITLFVALSMKIAGYKEK